MSEITQNIVVQPNNINVTVDNNSITFTPTDINLNIYSGGFAQVNGNVGELQYNNGGILGGVPNTLYNGATLTLGAISNLSITGGSANYVLTTNGSGNLSWTLPTALALNANIANTHISGGTNGYVLQTDGAGNLTWTAQSGGGGNGTPGGSNTQLQFNNAGNFGGIVGTTYDGANFTLGNISNVKLNGGNAGDYVKTDGAGNLSFGTSPAGTGWSNVANIAINDICIGTLYGNLTGIQPGCTVSTSTTIDTANWTVFANSISTNGTNVIVGGTSLQNYIYLTSDTSNVLYRTSTGATWSLPTTPFNPTGVVQANNNVIIYQTGSNRAAYSTNDGANWTNANTTNSTLLLAGAAYGNGTVIITTRETSANIFLKSTNDGLTWSNTNIGSNTYSYVVIAYGNSKFMTVPRGTSTVGKITADNGNTWSNITMSDPYLWRGLAYGNGRWVTVSEYTGVSTRGSASVSTDDGATWTTTLLANVSWNGVAYVSGTFVITNSTDGNIRTSTDGITWSANISTGLTQGGFIAFNQKNNLLTVTSYGANTASTLSPKILVTTSDGNISNSQTTPSGTYRNLGGSIGNVGAMWVRTA